MEPAGLIALAERLHLAEHGCDGNCGQPMPVGWAARAYDLGVRAEQETRDPVPEGHSPPTRDYWRQRALDAEARATAPAAYWEPCRDFDRPASCATNDGTGLWCEPCLARRDLL